ncbi:NAD(P)-dependent alcohol dehydrogenase [uncultured Bartonella sp.]|uniref:NAD(P)-dependent alcohol dehydrogenase n=1 Tax=uncultured Bartonella sp. TaxID=104108 RepID=UPI0026201322|nr:NAD(P)-dependent alcohol dehydrogenase [uncultured Bartonella sp.]
MDHKKQQPLPRREFLKESGATVLAAGAIVEAGVSNGQTKEEPAVLGKGPWQTRAFAAQSKNSGFAPITITRRALQADDILLDILYVGICHSDIHAVHSDWGETHYPIVPGHEIVGRVIAVGRDVTRFKVGDIGGVGCMVDACGICENCLDEREQNCLNGTTFTYDSPDKVSGGYTYGGYSDRIVVNERFVIRIPSHVHFATYAPLLCAGVTTFSPLRHWKLEKNQKFAVVGLGGLGHMALKLAHAMRADVTVFTTTKEKIADAKKMGAKDAFLWTDSKAFDGLANSFDLMISTVPVSYPMQPFMDMLKLDATLVNVGALGELTGGLNGMANGFGRKSLAGSMIGGIAETQEVIDYCAARHIEADIELITPDQIDRAYERVMAKDVRYRFVIDFASGKPA